MRAALLLVVLLAGCAAPALPAPAPNEAARYAMEPNGVAPQARAGDAFWMVWVHGHENATQDGPTQTVAMCSIVFDHALDPAARTLRVRDASAIPESFGAAVAFDHFDRGDCPLAYEARFATQADATLGRYGALRVTVHDNGTLEAAQRWVPLGQRLVVSYRERAGDTTYEGRFVVENLGAWPRSAASGGGAEGAP